MGKPVKDAEMTTVSFHQTKTDEADEDQLTPEEQALVHAAESSTQSPVHQVLKPKQVQKSVAKKVAKVMAKNVAKVMAKKVAKVMAKKAKVAKKQNEKKTNSMKQAMERITKVASQQAVNAQAPSVLEPLEET